MSTVGFSAAYLMLELLKPYWEAASFRVEMSGLTLEQKAFLARAERRLEQLALDIKHLEGESSSTKIKVAGGTFEVEYHPHAASRQWQTNFGRLQREQQEATQEEDAEWENDVMEEITEELQKLVVNWDLEYDGEPIPISALGLDMLSMPVQQALFQGLLADASGGSEEEKKRSRKRSKRGSS